MPGILAGLKTAKGVVALVVALVVAGAGTWLWFSRAAALAEAVNLRAQVATLTERTNAVTSERDAALERIRENSRAIAALRERADTEAREADKALAELDRRNREWRRRLEVMRPGVDGMNAFVAEVL